MRIRQSQVQQGDVHSTFREMNHRFTHPQEVRQFEIVRFLRTKHLSEQTDVSRVVINQKNLQCLSFHNLPSRGNLTTDSQKLAMLFTTLRNPSRSTGFVM